jgi:hypothetical protein
MAAAQSVFVFTIAIGLVNFLGRSLIGGKAVLAAGPFAQIDQFAALAAKRAVRIASVLGLFLASGALHKAESGLVPDLSDEIVFQTFRDFDGVELSNRDLPVTGVID